MERKQTLSIELPNPVYSSQAIIESIKKMISTMLATVYTNIGNGIGQAKAKSSLLGKLPKINLKKPNFRFGKKGIVKIVLPVIGILVFLTVLSQAFNARPSIQGESETVSDKPLASQVLNREFSFPLRDEEGEEVASFKYIIESAELRNQIIVKGQRATSVEGRVFLILNLKLVNDMDQGININTRDYVRITVNGKDDELFAPDIHNDPVETQAISTKNTRLGLAINENDKEIVVRVGEIDGEKQEIKLNLK